MRLFLSILFVVAVGCDVPRWDDPIRGHYLFPCENIDDPKDSDRDVDLVYDPFLCRGTL